MAVVPGAAGGIILGGFITKRLDATIAQHINLTFISTFMAAFFSFLFYLESYVAFLVCLAPMMALVFIGSVSCQVILMRTVPHHHRGIAVGIQSISFRLLGSVPGPLLMGALFDAACIEWDGACRQYDIPRLRHSWFGFAVGICCLTGFFFLLQVFTWRKRLAKEAAKLTRNGGSSSKY